MGKGRLVYPFTSASHKLWIPGVVARRGGDGFLILINEDHKCGQHRQKLDHLIRCLDNIRKFLSLESSFAPIYLP